MQHQPETKKERVIEIGPDRVTIREQEVVIEAKHEMPDWEVRDFEVVPIYFEDKKYFLVEKHKTQPPFAVRYVLLPWKEGLSANARRFHAYDAETVAERDATRRSGIRDEAVHAYLLLFYPFLGLLWSGAQKRLTRFGFVPHTISGVSIFTVFSLLFAQGVFTAVTINASGHSGKLIIGGMIRAFTNQDRFQIGPVGIPVYLLDGLLTLAFLSDVPVRYARYMHEHDWSGGFLEWLWRRSDRNK